MRITIATPLYPPQIGGPAKYAKELKEEFTKQGHQVSVVSFGALERMLPSGVRHIVYFLRLLPRAVGSDGILALDTMSVGLPALWVSFLLDKKLVVRVGGDFLWESYVERTGSIVRVSDFYTNLPQLTAKERLIRRLTARLMQNAEVAFNSEFQKQIWMRAYSIPAARAHVVGNPMLPKLPPHVPRGTVFVAAGRKLKLKNIQLLREVFAELKQTHPEVELDTQSLPAEKHIARLKDCYAVVVSSLSDMNPNVLYESVAAGKPFIATEDSGAPEQLRGLGIFIDTRSKAAWRAAFAELLDQQHYTRYTQAIAAHHGGESFADVARRYALLIPRI